ncbi:DUF4900 domain-containing protein [bacterium]|nr:DUF4900 domain-containing protein [bacterium]
MKKKGVILFVVLVWGLILTLTGMGFLYLAHLERENSYKVVYPAEAFWLAEAGVEHGKAWLDRHLKVYRSPPSYMETFAPFEPQQLGRGEYEVFIVPPMVTQTHDWKIVSVGTVETYSPGKTITTKKELSLRVKIKSFARYAYFTDFEKSPGGDTIWFTNNDRAYGPVHTNDTLNIYKDPLFDGYVTSGGKQLNYYHGGPPTDKPQFKGGYELGVASIDMSKFINMGKLQEASVGDDGINVVGKTTVTLSGNTFSFTEDFTTAKGTTEARTWSLNNSGNLLTSTYTDYVKTTGWFGIVSWKEETKTITKTLTPFFNGVFYATGDINIASDGKVYKHMTIATEKNIYINGHIKYSHSPSNPAAQGLLGLVAEKNIEVTTSAPNNLVIHASLMAFDGSFGVKNYNSGKARGALTIWGGIVQKYRGPVGTFNSSTGTYSTGYYKDYHYDYRVTAVPPPSFPQLEEGPWERLLWEESPFEVIK